MFDFKLRDPRLAKKSISYSMLRQGVSANISACTHLYIHISQAQSKFGFTIFKDCKTHPSAGPTREDVFLSRDLVPELVPSCKVWVYHPQSFFWSRLDFDSEWMHSIKNSFS